MLDNICRIHCGVSDLGVLRERGQGRVKGFEKSRVMIKHRVTAVGLQGYGLRWEFVLFEKCGGRWIVRLWVKESRWIVIRVMRI
ncbi:hypothetical protein Tco_1489337 [Tanacetum coccineum]